MMTDLEERMNQSDFIGSVHEFEGKSFQVAVADNFSYKDPIDGSLSVKQVISINNYYITLLYIINYNCILKNTPSFT